MINHPAAKAIVAALVAGVTAALVIAQTAIPLSPAEHGWVTVALAFLGAVAVPLAVYRQGNAPVVKPPAYFRQPTNSGIVMVHMSITAWDVGRGAPTAVGDVRM